MNSQEVTPATTAAQRVFRRTPEVEVFEDDQALFLSADVPGVAAGSVEVSLDDDVLSVSARAEQDGVTTEFARRFTLREPSRYDATQISATLRHGVLDLRVPKAERAKRRQIPVSAS